MNLEQILADHAVWLTEPTKGSCADLRGAYLNCANLEGADLESAYLVGADLVGANLKGANLRSANLEYANLIDANLEGAYLGGANLEGANLEGADLKGADLEGTNIQIFNTAHHFGFLHEDLLTIGCESRHIEHWRKYIKEIGKRHSYSDKDIKQTITLIKCLLKIQKDNK